MKKILANLFIVTMVITGILGASSNIAYGDEKLKVVVDNNEIDFSKYGAEPFVNKANSTMLPFRSIFEQFDGYINTAQYNSHKLITFSNDDDYVLNLSLYEKENRIGMLYILENQNDDVNRFDEVYTWSIYNQPIVNINGRVYVPVRAISEAWGYDVDWDGTTKTVIVNTDVQNINVPDDAVKLISNELPLEYYNIDGTPKSKDNNDKVIDDNKKGNDNDLNLLNEYQLEVYKLTNKERENVGLNPLLMDLAINDVAALKADDMAKNKYFNHNSPTYGTPFNMLSDYNIKFGFAGENIASGQATPSEVVESWMNSAGHRENILNPNYKKIGIGYAINSNETTYWTQLFTD